MLAQVEAMARGDTDDINRALGELIGELRTLKDELERRDDRAIKSRGRLYDLTAELNRRLIETEQTVKTIRSELDDITPTVDRFKSLETQGLGIWSVLKGAFRAINWIAATLFSILGALLSMYWDRLIEYFSQ